MAFKKDLRLIDIWSLALGSIIGWGCFVLPGTSFLVKAGPLGTIIGLIIGGLVVSIVGINYGYLIEKYPKSGGEFVYAKDNFGKVIGFICGWFLLLAYISIVPLNATAIGLVCRYVFGDIMQQGYLYTIAGWDVYAGEIIVAELFLLFFAYINIKGAKQAGKFQSVIVILLVFTVIAVTFGVFAIHRPTIENLTPAFPQGVAPLSGILAIAAMAPWAFVGFDCIPQASEEFNFSTKKAKGLIFISIFCAVAMYSAITLVTAGVFKWDEFIGSNPFWATGEAVKASLGFAGMFLLVTAILCAVISGINGFYMSSSRLIYSMSQENALPKSMGELSQKTGTPKNAIIFILLVSLATPFFGRQVLGWVVDMCSVGVSIAYMITSLAAFKQSLKDGKKLYMVSGILGAVVSFGFLMLLLVPGMPGYLSIQSLIALGIWVVLGVIFYFKRGINKQQ